MPFERHVERADQPVEAVAAVREQRQADAIEHAARVRVDEEGDGRHRQDPSDRAARRLEHEQNGDARRARGRSASDPPRDR